ncbi:MAG TPA: Spo0E family sporulation regulatory protein-aspartic acid phosphatase [Clostridium sp.]|jgi:hypothetical protein|uniref:Spo0E family sporulation regulatory protein-aspartic acid phosphatase n=1 Tax=Clostridium kluyveri (strain ATCC 8527 / DSM 555 / NBRC 12016 / NCIMB 10680 / K1) TaxID=431943 RepID=A5MYR5_CLOK5|nr:aspartyl-phosphate phosphatase Spo0E family protein [Clostridium kluyveri]EDK34011.1 Hypothetical protein CKL_1999 [Clostridium kluyveri DSM 555]HBC98065.1 Spo0E family sporulation regulatory protein-aspartic acid phosphatase [Clostridium sp.]
MTIEAARDKLHECMDLYDLSDIRTLEASQEMDEFVNEEMRKMMEGKKGKYDTARSSSIRSL